MCGGRSRAFARTSPSIKIFPWPGHFGNTAIYRRPSRALETFAAVSQEKGSLVDQCFAKIVTTRIVSRIAES